ncbi:hypothetical protein KIL84_009687 [Mauremys mutica]|uniref:Uncharacterized protein n=1 Tax=Mauremys mutica TaxID=74926 RepID=A0A9D4B5A8_9SAUR|nr:hypothetical protein KIL84_009687 [Mauremys mutica]
MDSWLRQQLSECDIRTLSNTHTQTYTLSHFIFPVRIIFLESSDPREFPPRDHSYRWAYQSSPVRSVSKVTLQGAEKAVQVNLLETVCKGWIGTVWPWSSQVAITYSLTSNQEVSFTGAQKSI